MIAHSSQSSQPCWALWLKLMIGNNVGNLGARHKRGNGRVLCHPLEQMRDSNLPHAKKQKQSPFELAEAGFYEDRRPRLGLRT